MYDPEFVSSFYDAYGEREWERFESGLANRVNLHIHLSYLRRFVRPGNHVLDAGAGPGRFTIEMAKLGALVTVGDISPRQLEQNRARVTEAGYENSVVARKQLDIVDLSAFASETFDVTVCYGAPLSYLFDRADQALDELLRVTRPGGYLLLSVMSLIGACRAFLPGIVELARQHGLDEVNRINSTGDLNGPLALNHRAHMYRWSELEAMLNRHACKIEAASASNFLSINSEAVQQVIDDSPDIEEALFQWELDYCAQPGVLDGGTHILAVVQRL
jgi:SAM-dependent methyltransferase